MLNIEELIINEWNNISKIKISKIEIINNSASNRKYFRLKLNNNKNYIATYGLNIDENKTFFYYSNILEKSGINVPKVIDIKYKNKYIYFQEDLGNINLLEYTLNNINSNKTIINIYKKVILDLINIQFNGKKNIDFNKAYSFKSFDKKVILQDLFYFKNFFLDNLKIEYNSSNLIENFFDINIFFESKIIHKYYVFMYRDFQGRNIVLNENNKLGYIDFQGGMLGPLQYDIISLLFQAKSTLNNKIKFQLLEFYKDEISKKLKSKFILKEYNQIFNYCFLIRHLQVLGAYGLRGLIEKKLHFRESINFILNNLSKYKLTFIKDLNNIDELKNIINFITSKKFKNQIFKLLNE